MRGLFFLLFVQVALFCHFVEAKKVGDIEVRYEVEEKDGYLSWGKHISKMRPRSFKSKRGNKDLGFYDNTIIGTSKTLRWHMYFGSSETPATISNVHLTNSTDFSILATSCNPSNSSGYCYVDLKFTPTSKGKQTAYISETYHITSACPGPACHPITEVSPREGFGVKKDEDPECKSEEDGSILKIESKSVSEEVAIVDTDFTLRYSSDHSEEFYTPYTKPIKQSNFNPEGWTVSIQHYYDAASERLFMGTGDTVKRKKIILSNGNSMVVNGDDAFVFLPDGTHVETKSSLTGYLKYSFSYTSSNKLEKIVDSYGKETTFNRDSSGNLSSIVSHYGKTTNIVINANGMISEIINPKNESYKINYYEDRTDLMELFIKPEGHTSSFEYVDYGWLISDEGSGGNRWDLSYGKDENDSPITDKVSQMGRYTTYASERDDVTNKFSKVIYGPEGFETRYTESTDLSQTTSNMFESSESVTAIDERFGAALNRVSTTSETRNSLTRFTEFLKSVTLSDPNDPFSYSQIVSTTKVNGVSTVNTFNKANLTSTTVDPMGVTSVTTLDNFERPVMIQHGNDVPTSISYDSLGRVSQTTQNGTNTTAYSYNIEGEIASITNALNQTTSYLYDEAGRTTRITYPDGRFLRYRYNKDGKITAIFPPSRPAHVFAFNALELPSVYRPPMIPETTTPQTRYYYNLDKQLTVIKRPDGKSVRYNYEPEIGLLMSMVLGLNERQTYAYQELSNKPRVINSPDAVRSVFSYFGMNQIASEQQTIDQAMTKMIHGFDNFFRANRRIVQLNGAEVSRVVTAFRDDHKPIRVGEMRFTYDSISGRLVSTILDKIRDRRTYDTFGNLKSYQATYHPDGGAAQELYFYTLTRDSLHRIVTKIERVQGVRTSYEYSYDSVGRLSSVTKNGVVDSSYTYDANSNRISGTQNGEAFTATYDSQDRLLTYAQGSEAPKQFTYNLNGELTQIEQGSDVTTFVPDSLGRLKSVTLPDNTGITYKLDWTGRRSARSVNGVQVVRSVFENDYQLAAEFDASNNLREYISYTNVNSSDYFKQGPDLYRIIKDHLGSPRLVVKADDASVAQKMDYNEWGKVIVDTNPGLQPFGFAGGLYDKDTKLVKFGARDYDGRVGRWVSKDPIRFEGGDSNFYGYALQDPVNLFDPYGLSGVAPGFRPYTPMTPNINNHAKPAPKGIMSRVDDLCKIMKRQSDIENEAKNLDPKDQKYKDLSNEYDQLYNDMWENINIFNDLTEPGLST